MRENVIRKENKNKRFKKIYVEITNVCNLKCDFCPAEIRTFGYMAYDKFCEIIDKIKPFTDHVSLHVKGEPLLHPELEKILGICSEKGIKVNLTTNGTRIKKCSDILIKSPAVRQINFSLHSFDGNKGRGNKAEYLDNIFKFISSALSETQIIISLRLWNLESDNENNIRLQLNKESTSAVEKEYGLEYTIEDKLTPGRGIKLSEKLFLNYEKKFSWPKLSDDFYQPAGFCQGLRDQAAILVDGTVVPCCIDGDGIINLGNIFTREFGEIMEGERAVNIYKGFSNRKAVEELCKKCSVKGRFD